MPFSSPSPSPRRQDPALKPDDPQPDRAPSTGLPDADRWTPGEVWHSGESWPHDETWTQRPHDHLVEPMFGGLGVGAPEDTEVATPVRKGPAVAGWLGAVVLAAILVWWLAG